MDTVKVKSVKNVTHDVLKIVIEKPPQYSFSPGQATEIAIKKIGWQKELRPFTFTSLPTDDSTWSSPSKHILLIRKSPMSY